jgi:hypothetical protein
VGIVIVRCFTSDLAQETMYSSHNSARINRNSVFTTSNSQAIACLRAKIKSLDKSANRNDTSTSLVEFDPHTYGVEVVVDHFVFNGKSKMIRRAYLIENNYKVGWVVDCDLDVCMLCGKDFGWMRARLKHHCRACGSLVCHDCSPFLTDIPVLMEDHGSRVCKNCFGLKPGVYTPLQNPPSTLQKPSEPTAVNLFETPRGSSTVASVSSFPNNMSSSSLMRNNITPDGSVSVRSIGTRRKSLKAESYHEQLERLDQEQLPKYEEAYR